MEKKVPLLKRAQAGLEFLTTYAWAFVVILIVIGALTYFGVTDPTRILPDRCNFGAEFNCINHIIDASNSQVRLQLQNGQGEVLVASGFSLRSETGEISCTDSGAVDPWVPGNLTEILFTSCDLESGGFVAGKKEKLLVQFDWYEKKSGSNYERTAQGEMFSAVR